MHIRTAPGWRIPAGLIAGVIFWSLVAWMGVHPLFG
jgi:hypothetical protein